jgi:hypothetical protein
VASPHQQQALRRKLIYIGLIVGLFTVSGIFRLLVVESTAERLSLREQYLGDVKISSSALQLSLTGSRGFVISAMWYWSMDAMKKNKWNELELYTVSLTQLQPHFITPWLFQSWNLAYNVSVEADQPRDKYFYFSRGVHLLCEGERQNRFHPDMRFNIGMYMQHKIMQSDETNAHRCLFQMSCIPYPERDPERFWTTADGRKVIDMAVFEKFCIDHPQFVRRLHDKLRCGKPEDVVLFLKENKGVPSIFEDDPEVAGPAWHEGRYPLKKPLDRFPTLPPPASVRDDELPTILDDTGKPVKAPGYGPDLSSDSELHDDFDAYAAARAWYAYAQECLPQPHPTIPGQSAPIVDRVRQRHPKMTTNLFRNHPPRAQSGCAERLRDEGWFGPEGWLITGWFPRDQFHDGREARVGTGQNWGEDAWHKSYEMWKLRCRRSLMDIDPQRLEEMLAVARSYLARFGRVIGEPPPGNEPPEGDPDRKPWQDSRFVHEYFYSRQLSNAPHFLVNSRVEMEPEANNEALIAARRTVFDARQNARQGRRDRAAELLESKTGLERLRRVLERNADFREDNDNAEEFFEVELRYVKLMQDMEGDKFKRLMAAGSLLGAGAAPGPQPGWPMLIGRALTDPSLMPNLPVPEFEPPEHMQLEALVKPDTVKMVKIRHGLAREDRQQGPPPGATMPSGRPIPPGMMKPPPAGKPAAAGVGGPRPDQ